MNRELGKKLKDWCGSQATNLPLNNDKKKKNWMSSSFFRNFALF